MILRWSRWLAAAFAFVVLFANFSTAWMDQRPLLEVRDGNLFVISAKDKNITLQTLGSSYVNINEINLVHVATSAQAAARLVERWKLGALADMENTLNRLVETVDSFSLNNTAIRPDRRPKPPNFPDPGKVRLITRINQLEMQMRALVQKIETDECTSNPCQNGGTCEDRIDGYICRCIEGWEGPQCNLDVNECARFAGTDLGCQNGATCRNLPGTYRCECSGKWHGIHCTKQSLDCNNENSNELCGHGVCVNKPGSVIGFTCICDQGWESDGTNPACIKDVDECARKHPACSVSPMVPCINVPGTYYCGGCPPGYTGNGYYCADIDECTINNGGCSITPFVQCQNTIGSRVCANCPAGYQGDGVTCTYVGVCRINNGGCHPLATCINNPGMSEMMVLCQCPSGYQGDGMGPNGCQLISGGISGPTACSHNPCIHGTCIPNGQNDYICRCVPGYSGRNCNTESDPCTPNPCKNGGTCRVSARRTALCRCTSSFSGPRCNTARESCGGTITDPEGILRYPNSGLVYQNSLSCAWVLTTNSSMVLNVTFTAFHLEESENCQYDFVQIHDGPTAGDHMIGKYCGQNLPRGTGNIVTSQRSMYLWLHSDHSVSHEGFTLEWNSIPPMCGGVIRAEHGSISSPGSPGKYPPNRDCHWYIISSPGKRIQFHFFSLMLEEHPTCGKDYLEIKNGPDDESQRLGIYCNHTHPPPLITTGDEVFVHFHSDGSGQDAGFQLTFSSIPGMPGCGDVYTASSGYITSPNFVNGYDSSMDCEWKIQVPEHERIKVTWISFELEHSRRCYFDFIEIYNGEDREAPLAGRYCGNELPPDLLSTSNILLIRFKSDWSMNFKGFHLKYEVWCGGVFTDQTGVLMSPYYPNRYPESRICVYEIAQPVGKAIEFTILSMDIEDLSFADCSFDYLQIHDGDNENSTLIGTYCGNNASIPEFPLVSTHNYMWIKFKTDNSIGGQGFYATYTTVDVNCGGILKTSPGIIQPPLVDGEYRDNEECSWLIQAPSGFVIKLDWHSFNLENHMSCRYDYVKISENITRNTQEDLGTYCGTNLPPTITSQSRIMSIKFHSDQSWTKGGFMASYIFIDASKTCGGYFRALTGILRSPNYPESYPGGKTCEWIITAPNKHQVVLNIKSFDIENHQTCTFDYLEIRNGGLPTSPLLGKYCGTTIPPQIRSFSAQIYVKFVTDESRTRQGFEIEWDSTTVGCGGTMTMSTGSITSPYYPQPYNHAADCTWNIKIAAGSIIQFMVVDLELEEDRQCMYDYIEIYEGPNRRNKKLGRYCNSNNPLAIQTTSNIASVRFRSDRSGVGRGFHINYKTMCHNTLHGYRGVIESPNFPNDYVNGENCTWIIEAPLGNKVNITFSHFELERAYDNCMYDSLTIKEGADNQPHREIGKYCGLSKPSQIVSTERQVFLQFNTDRSNTHHGFRLEWVVNGCGGILTKPEGTITSPGYPSPYPSNLECEWSIEVDYLHSIEVTLVDVKLETAQKCMYDKLSIYAGADETAPKLIDSCDTNHSVIATSSSHQMFIKFRADNVIESSGFKLTYRAVDIQCGGRFTVPSSLIHSPNYPGNYPKNQNCEWLIQVSGNHLINLTFTDFDIENTLNCTDDYVRIYDGSTRDSPILGSHCHNTLPPPYLSSSNELLVVMRTDSYVTAKGFMANYSLACGARIVTNDQGILSIDPTIGSHTDIVNCSWIIVAQDPDDHVTLTLTDLQILNHTWHDKCESSSVQVYQGEGTDGPLVINLCGTTVPPPITSEGNALTIQVSSPYAFIYQTRFTATYTVSTSACGGNYTSEHGAITTPGYPNNYPQNVECIWNFRTSPGNSISLNFKDFDLVESDNCNLDYVEVREENSIGKFIGVYCGKNINTINSLKSLWVKFSSNGDITKKGFSAEYHLSHGNDLSGPSGQIASPLYPKPCMLLGKYHWRITVDFRYSIQIDFQDFHLESFSADDCFTSVIIYDGYDENAPKLMEKCGFSLPQSVRSSSNVVYITFDSSSIRVGTWFLLNWLQVPRDSGDTEISTFGSECNKIVSLSGMNNDSYTFNSPGWPNGYGSNLDCSWTFESLPGTHLILRFDVLNLEESDSCQADQVKVYSGNPLGSQKEWTHVGDYCYSNSTYEIIEGSNLMKVTFHSDIAVNKTGFKASVRKICGGQLYGPNGAIEVNSTTATSHYRIWSINCQWNVSVRPGRYIEVKFINLHILNYTDMACGNNYLMLKNGGSASSPLLGIGKYCGTETPTEPLLTTGNELYVQSIGPKSSTEFKIIYREVGMNCGEEIQLTDEIKSWEITTPNYPNIPHPYSECFWTIMAPSGEQIMIHFETFDLTSDPNCDKEYLEVKDGGTDISAPIAQLCNDKLPSSITTSGNFMYLHFYTDIPNPKNGFKAVVSIEDNCGGIKRGSEGSLWSPNYPSAYPTNINCTWNIIGPPGHTLKLNFQDLNLPNRRRCENADYVDVSEEILVNSTSTVLHKGQYCGSTRPEMIETSRNQAKIFFKSDTRASNQFRGFKMNFTSSLQACGGSLEAMAGEFSSPGYPSARSIDFRNCEWKITVPEGYRVQVDILDLDLGGEDTGPMGFGPRILFYNGLNYKSQNARVTSSSSARQFSSTSNSMLVWYWATSGDHRGFKARFSAAVPALCSSAETSDHGTLTSAQDPLFNMTTFYCNWKITSPTLNTTAQTLALTISGIVGGFPVPGTLKSCRTKSTNIIINNGGDLTSCLSGNLTDDIIIRSPLPINSVTAVKSVWNDDLVNFTLSYRWHQCGGILRGPSHIVSAPTNLTFPIECVWHAKFPNNGEVIVLSFKKLNLRCQNSYIFVRAGGPLSPEIEKVCGSIIPRNITSQSNELWIEYHAKDMNNEFEFQLNTVQGGCGGLVYGTGSEFSSPSFPKQYPNNAECQWFIQVENGYHIGLTFVDRFHLEDSPNCANDFVQVFDWVENATTRTGSLSPLGKVCGRNASKPFNSTSNQMAVLFRSNNAIRGDGFRARWNVNCGGILEVSRTTQYLTSPGWPNSYYPNLNCNYTFVAPEQNFIVAFTEFQLERGRNCMFDNITVVQHASYYKNNVEVWCATKDPPPTLRGNSRLELHFKTDRSFEYRGFQLKYYIDTCGGMITRPTDISSPSIDDSGNYYKQINCTWSVTAPAGKAVVLRFQSFHLEYSLRCYYDFVAVYSDITINEDKRLALLCGNLNASPPAVKSVNGSMTINFITDQSRNYGGFKAKILFTNNCGGQIQLNSQPQTFRTPSSVINEPLHCEWIIRAPSNNVIKLKITNIDLTNVISPSNGNQTRSCSGNYLEIRDGQGPFSELIDRYCGTVVPAVSITSSSNSMWITLITDGSVNGNGVTGTLENLESPCGNPILTVGNQTKVLTSPHFPASYNPGLRCRWILSSSESWTTFDIHFQQLDIEESENCNDEKLSLIETNNINYVLEGLGEDHIFAGTDQNFHQSLIGLQRPEPSFSYCGNRLPHDYYSSGGDVEIKFVSSQNPKSTHSGFKLEYKLSACDHNFTAAQGRIVHKDITNCWFTITAPVGWTISLYFNTFTIYDSESCTSKALQIRDGDFSSSTLAQLCGTELPPPVFSSGNKLSLHSWSQDSYSFESYDITYTTTDKGRGCGGKLYNYLGRFTSPLYPGPYRNESQCVWEVSVPIGFIVMLHFEEFDIGSRNTCSTDFLEVANVLSDGETSAASTYCGRDKPDIYRSAGDKVKVTYHTSVNNGGLGWIIIFVAEPRGQL